MLATFAFDVCHDVYRAARDVIDAKIPTLNAENSGKYQWRPDRLPRLAEYVCDFARAGEKALGGSRTGPGIGGISGVSPSHFQRGGSLGRSPHAQIQRRQAEACPTSVGQTLVCL